MNVSQCKMFACSVGLVVSLSVIGCTQQGAEYNVAPVKGKVVSNGEPVTSGSIRFQPVSVEGTSGGQIGKPARGTVKEDGTFQLSTYGENDGAVVGKHRVMYLPVVQGAESYEDEPTPSPYAGLEPKQEQVEVKPGQNEITIELVPGS